jgi:hypothetical protein
MTNQGAFGKNQGDYGLAVSHLREAILHCIFLSADDDAEFKGDIGTMTQIFEKLKTREAKAKETKECLTSPSET